MKTVTVQREPRTRLNTDEIKSPTEAATPGFVPSGPRRLLGEDQVPGNPRHSLYVSKEREDILRGDHTAVQSRHGVLHVHSNKDPPGKA